MTWISTPGAFAAGSDNFKMLVPLLTMLIEEVTGFGSGPDIKESWVGVTVSTGCTLAMAVRLTVGMFVKEVFIVICPWVVPEDKGGHAVIIN